jgi:hypothetical protein
MPYSISLQMVLKVSDIGSIVTPNDKILLELAIYYGKAHQNGRTRIVL